MGQALIVTLREGLEAALIVSIVLACLRHVGYQHGFRPVLWGVATAVAASIIVGTIIFYVGFALEGKAEAIFEGVTMLLAVGVLGWMVVWMKRQARHIKSDLETQVRGAVLSGSGAALASIAFLAVGREGLETTIFLFASSQTATPLQTLSGGLLGLTIAAALGVMIYRSSRFINLKVFFNVTGVLIIFVAAGLLAQGIHELQASGLLPIIVEHVWDTNSMVDEKAGIGRFLKSLLGYNGNPSLSEVIAYPWFLVTTLAYFFISPARSYKFVGAQTATTPDSS